MGWTRSICLPFCLWLVCFGVCFQSNVLRLFNFNMYMAPPYFDLGLTFGVMHRAKGHNLYEGADTTFTTTTTTSVSPV